MADPDRHVPLNHLMTALQHAGSELQQAVGALRVKWYSDMPVHAGDLREIECAISKAQRALDNYRRLVGSDPSIAHTVPPVTRKEFDGATLAVTMGGGT